MLLTCVPGAAPHPSLGARCSYEENYTEELTILRACVRQAQAATSSTDYARHKDTADSAFGRAEAHIKSMEMAARGAGVGPTEKKSLIAKTKQHKADLKGMRADITAAKDASNRGELLGGPRPAGGGGGGASSKDKLMATQGVIDKTTDTLQATLGVLKETEDIASATADTLGGQGDQLRGAHGQVQETRNATVEARGILRKMAVQAMMNKAILWFIILILVGANIAVIYVKYIKKSSDPTPAPAPPTTPAPTPP